VEISLDARAQNAEEIPSNAAEYGTREYQHEEKSDANAIHKIISVATMPQTGRKFRRRRLRERRILRRCHGKTPRSTSHNEIEHSNSRNRNENAARMFFSGSRSRRRVADV